MSSINENRKIGWQEAETELLLREAALARSNNQPLRQVFNRVASMTGRQPNSIRNYYYLKAKEQGIESKATFVPFSNDEVYDLVREILMAQARGESVRAATMRLGGNKTNMLRLQNKYRSVIKLKRDLVDRVMADLEAEGAAYCDPYAQHSQRGRKPAAGSDLNDIREELDRLSREHRESQEREREMSAQLKENSERLLKLCSMLNHVMALNRDFMEFNGIGNRIV